MFSENTSIVSKIAHESESSCYFDTSSSLQKEFWWNHLMCNFHKLLPWFHLDAWDLLRIKISSLSDICIRTAAASILGTMVIPFGFHPHKIDEAFADREIYESKSDTGDPNFFFRDPPYPVSVDKSLTSWPFFNLKGGTCEILSFKSPYEPLNPRLKNDFLPDHPNMTAYARYWRHHDGPRPTICLIHGFFADSLWMNELLFVLSWFYKMDCDVLFFTLPFHGSRKNMPFLFSGYGMYSGGFSRINEAFAQAIFDIRIFLNYLEKERGVQKFGITGVSIGGYLAALMAAVEKRLAFSIPIVPVASIADLVMEMFPLSILLKTFLIKKRMSIKEIRHIFAVHTPLTYPPVIPKDRLMIVGGVGDRFAPPNHSMLLWYHWQYCKIYWFPGSHLFHLDKGKYLKEIHKFLNEIGFIDNYLDQDLVNQYSRLCHGIEETLPYTMT
ncbi:MAG: alpha/beta hydrolase family protein [Desulfobacterales bacterium]|nr:alpha/beta hydrolase family protein [Desulfobacterales bacterium]MBF0395778.1 alpha/beta hydrolase family protein [Desulfobacterales bacterium]